MQELDEPMVGGEPADLEAQIAAEMHDEEFQRANNPNFVPVFDLEPEGVPSETRDPQVERVVHELLREMASNLPNGAFVAPTARILGSDVQIGPRAIISDYAVVYDHTVIGADAYVGPQSVIGSPNADGYSNGAAILLPGVGVGAGSVVESGTIVYKTISHRSVVTRNSWKQRALRFISRFWKRGK